MLIWTWQWIAYSFELLKTLDFYIYIIHLHGLVFWTFLFKKRQIQKEISQLAFPDSTHQHVLAIRNRLSALSFPNGCLWFIDDKGQQPKSSLVTQNSEKLLETTSMLHKHLYSVPSQSALDPRQKLKSYSRNQFHILIFTSLIISIKL